MMATLRWPITLFALLVLTLVGLPRSEEAATYDTVVKPFFVAHCVKCHGDKVVKGELRLDTLTRDFASPGPATHWTDVMDRINAGAMPPKGEKRPDPKAAALVVQWIAGQFAETEALRLARRDKVTYYRLSREEYAHTVRDLLGVSFDPTLPTGLADDDAWQGFERVGAVMTLAPAHVEKYFAAAEAVLAEAFPTRPKGKAKSNALDQLRPAYKMRNGPRDWERVEKDGRADKVRAEIWPGHAVQHGRAGVGRVTASGEYRVRMQMSGLRPENGRAPHLVVYANELDRILYEADIDAPEDKPVMVAFDVHLPVGIHTLKVMNDLPGVSSLPRSGRDGQGNYFFSTKDRASRLPWQVKLTDEDGKILWPTLLLDWIEVKGPLAGDGPTFAEKAYLSKDARASVSHFAERAYRRPVRDAEVDRLMRLVAAETKAGETLADGLKTAFLAVLCSKEFIHVVEGSPEKARATVSDHELASRLSYFLGSTMPDAELLALAAKGRLSEPATLREQVRRLLKHPNARRFAASFPFQWLQLRNVGKFPPDKKLYPAYDDYLERSMVGESRAFFAEVLSMNLPIREFLDSDWTMLNGRLAEHYGIAGVVGSEFRRVALKPEHHRGGLLTQAAVLSLTSDGQRHRPVHRGKWVLETVFGRSPPPPPPNVEAIEPTPSDKPKARVRDKLAAHMSNPSCSACHRTFDPLGLAFDHFDAVGRWRAVEAVNDGQGANPKVDASGELADGRKFADDVELRKLLASDVDPFAAALAEKLAVYALRRTMTVDDRPHLAAVIKASQATEHRLAALIEALVVSDLFRRR